MDMLFCVYFYFLYIMVFKKILLWVGTVCLRASQFSEIAQDLAGNMPLICNLTTPESSLRSVAHTHPESNILFESPQGRVPGS